MSSNNWPVYAITAFGIAFILLAGCWPWLNQNLGAEEARPGQRLLSALLGLALLLICGIWFMAKET